MLLVVFVCTARRCLFKVLLFVGVPQLSSQFIRISDVHGLNFERVGLSFAPIYSEGGVA